MILSVIDIYYQFCTKSKPRDHCNHRIYDGTPVDAKYEPDRGDGGGVCGYYRVMNSAEAIVTLIIKPGYP